jgi:hypothetical protein
MCMYVCMYVCGGKGCSGPLLGLLLAKADDVAQPTRNARVDTIIHRGYRCLHPT